MVTRRDDRVGAWRWELTAPESWVLLNGPKESRQPLKLGLTELMVRGAVRVVESKGRFGRKTVLLADGARAVAPSEPPLQVLWELYRRGTTKRTSDGTGVPVDRLARAVKSQFGTVGRYVPRAVLPSLVERGLYEPKEGRFLFFFPRTTYEPTPAGEARRAELEGLLARGRESFGGWIDDDPAAAAAYVGSAGAAVLLAPELFPQLRRLHREVDSSLTTTSYSTTGFDVSDSDFSEALDAVPFDTSAFDCLDTAFDAIDSCVDAGGGGDGGSDGGNGDGGGGDGGGGDGGGGSDGAGG